MPRILLISQRKFISSGKLYYLNSIHSIPAVISRQEKFYERFHGKKAIYKWRLKIFIQKVGFMK
jgi:hypothetical protein